MIQRRWGSRAPSIDQQLLGSGARGPRMGDLKVQSSSYGTQIPRVYGSMRIAGTVIWATDLVESHEVSGVKGQPDTTYSYSVSLAVALSSRSILGIGRIWADGKLLRGAEGDFKVSTKFRFYPGSEDQVPDGFIASTEGIANTPAYRGLALAVFENLELAEYGNRIPFLTFEIFGDEGPARVSEVVRDATGGLADCTATDEVVGYAAYGESMKAAIQPLVDCFAVELFDDGSRLAAPFDDLRWIENADLGNSADRQPAPLFKREQFPARSLPSVIRLGYYDRALDYQAGEARATSADRRGSEEQRELPAVIDAGTAKALAQRIIAREWAARDRLTLKLPPSFLGLQPGARVEVDLSPRSWRVEQCTIDGFVVIAELRPSWEPNASVSADAGRIVAPKDVVAADVTLALFDLPDVLGLGFTTPTLLLAASSPSAGWKSCAVEIMVGQQVLLAQSSARKTKLGRALTRLEAEEDSTVEVQLIDAYQWLLSCDDDALASGINLAVLGSELIQFGAVEPLGAGRFKLSRLLRGRSGTELAMDGHVAGETFALMERDTLRAVGLPTSAIGSTVTASARNLSGTTSTGGPVILTQR